MSNLIQIITTEKDLQELFESAFSRAMERVSVPSVSPSEIIEGDELISRLNITRQTLSRWRKTNRIPFMQVGSVIRYDYLKVIEALEKKKGGRP